jgi:hypothetical protein
MNSKRRSFLTLGTLILAAIAVALVYERSVTPVRAASPPGLGQATVTMRCSVNPNGPGVTYVDSSDPTVTLPTATPDGGSGATLCGVALHELSNQGFTVQQAFSPADFTFLWVLTRGRY